MYLPSLAHEKRSRLLLNYNNYKSTNVLLLRFFSRLFNCSSGYFCLRILFDLPFANPKDVHPLHHILDQTNATAPLKTALNDVLSAGVNYTLVSRGER